MSKSDGLGALVLPSICMYCTHITVAMAKQHFNALRSCVWSKCTVHLLQMHSSRLPWRQKSWLKWLKMDCIATKMVQYLIFFTNVTGTVPTAGFLLAAHAEVLSRYGVLSQSLSASST